MTIAELARSAQVAPQTVYNLIGSKAAIVKAAYDELVAGDDDPVPMSERLEFRAVLDADSAETYGRAYARWTRKIYDRTGDFLAALVGHGSAGDPVLEDFFATIENERRTGNDKSIPPSLRDRIGQDLARVVDVVWVLTAPEVHGRLIKRARWTPDEYEDWLARELARALDPLSETNP